MDLLRKYKEKKINENVCSEIEEVYFTSRYLSFEGKDNAYCIIKYCISDATKTEWA